MNPNMEKFLALPVYQKWLILFLSCLIIVGVFWLTVYRPMGVEIDGLERQKSSLEKTLAENRRIASDLPKFRNEYEKLQKQLEIALKELPNKKEISSLLVSISELAKNSGLEVVEFKPGAILPKGFYAEVPVSLRLIGSFHEVAMFCFQVGNMTRIVNLSDLNLGSAKVEDGRNLLNIDCKATTFQFIENPAGTSATGKGKGKNR